MTMTLEHLLSAAIPAVHLDDRADKALEQMDVLHLSHLPVVDGKQFLGFVSEDALLDLDDVRSPIKALQFGCNQCYVKLGQHPWDVISTAEEHSSSLVAVLDDDKNYLGAIAVLDLANAIGKSYFSKAEGSSLVLMLNERDYSLSEIARLVESNGVKILHSYVDVAPEDAAKLLVTLKLNNPEMGRVIATLERFGYIVVQKFGKSDLPDLDLERLGSLLRFLNT